MGSVLALPLAPKKDKFGEMSEFGEMVEMCEMYEIVKYVKWVKSGFRYAKIFGPLVNKGFPSNEIRNTDTDKKKQNH